MARDDDPEPTWRLDSEFKDLGAWRKYVCVMLEGQTIKGTDVELAAAIDLQASAADRVTASKQA